ncbi:MAG: dipeptide epimerase [Fimbriimonas sp.]
MPPRQTIARIETYRLPLRLHAPFQIALQTTAVADNLFVRITTAEGLEGWGEASPLHAVTGETVGSCLAAVEFLGGHLLGRSALEVRARAKEMRALLPHNPAARSALDMALHDLASQAAGMPLYRYLGGDLRELVTDVTLGIDTPEATAEKARIATEDWGFRHLKMKLGLSPARDLAAVDAVRRTVGPGIELRLDANQAWGRHEAVEMLVRLGDHAIRFCEQPVPKEDLDGLRYVAERSPVAVMADEAVFGPADVLRVAPLPYVNLKIAKTGGIGELPRADAVAEASGMRSMLGCMMESRLGLTAAAHAALACESVRFLDLDTYFELADDPVQGGITYDRDRIALAKTPGLGAKLDASTHERGLVIE